jgi:hypothetical protein
MTDYPRKRRYSTDPQDDVPCRECETEGPEHALNDEGICRVCAAEDEDDGDEVSDALRQIATAIGTPKGVDPLADLPGLVLAVQAVVQRAESSAFVVASLTVPESYVGIVSAEVADEIERLRARVLELDTEVAP